MLLPTANAQPNFAPTTNAHAVQSTTTALHEYAAESGYDAPATTKTTSEYDDAATAYDAHEAGYDAPTNAKPYAWNNRTATSNIFDTPAWVNSRPNQLKRYITEQRIREDRSGAVPGSATAIRTTIPE